MAESETEQRNITLTITLNLQTMRHVISGSIPNPVWGEMLATILHEEMKFRLRSAMATEALAAQASRRPAIIPGRPS